ncbi:MAG: outer membrane beta-barrel domain-containing protein [Myxococcota bacterium]
MKMADKLIVAAFSATLLLWTPSASAQPAQGAEGDELDTSAVDERLDLYWAKKREVKSIHKRKFLKKSRHEFTLYGGAIPNDDFFMYYPLGGRYDYYFMEDLAAEVWGSYVIDSNSDLKDFLEGDAFNNSLVVNIPQSLQWMAGVDAIWSPIHGKFALFTNKLAHFDVHLAFGVGTIGTKVFDLGEEKSRVDVSGNVGLGFRFYINELLSIRADYRQFFFSAEGGGLSKPAEFTLGVSFWSPQPE